MQVNKISIIIITVLIMTSGTGIFGSLVFAQTDLEDSEIDFGSLTDSSDSQVDTTSKNGNGAQADTSGAELQQQQPQRPLSPPSTPPQQAQDNVAKSVTLDEDSFQKDLLRRCNSTFKCKQDSTTSWDNNTSMQISTLNNTKSSWSWISGKAIPVSPDKGYEVLTHMKLNNWSTASHVFVQGFNQTLKQWYPLVQCPTAKNGPLGWSEFKCKMTIAGDTTMIRPILNAGWSSQPNKQAITWFDTISVTALDRTATPATTPRDISAKGLTMDEGRAECRNIGFVAMCYPALL